ncbi:hypothetical protein GJ496_001452 [Pomphorhynchus laevis]|nr:hypothetical protein GJ496_001452 [Pomphorhynchus laevis]
MEDDKKEFILQVMKKADIILDIEGFLNLAISDQKSLAEEAIAKRIEFFIKIDQLVILDEIRALSLCSTRYAKYKSEEDCLIELALTIEMNDLHAVNFWKDQALIFNKHFCSTIINFTDDVIDQEFVNGLLRLLRTDEYPDVLVNISNSTVTDTIVKNVEAMCPRGLCLLNSQASILKTLLNKKKHLFYLSYILIVITNASQYCDQGFAEVIKLCRHHSIAFSIIGLTQLSSEQQDPNKACQIDAFTIEISNFCILNQASKRYLKMNVGNRRRQIFEMLIDRQRKRIVNWFE